jgi:hypothetical protein
MDDSVKRDRGRKCSAPDCPTVLSVYNSDHLCFAHADSVTRARFERRVSAETRLTPYRQRIDLPSLAVSAAP